VRALNAEEICAVVGASRWWTPAEVVWHVRDGNAAPHAVDRFRAMSALVGKWAARAGHRDALMGLQTIGLEYDGPITERSRENCRIETWWTAQHVAHSENRREVGVAIRFVEDGSYTVRRVKRNRDAGRVISQQVATWYRVYVVEGRKPVSPAISGTLYRELFGGTE